MTEKTISQVAMVIERTFEAPIALVWKMWTEAEHYKNWYGPNRFSIPFAEMDVRVGGKRLIKMQTPDGSMTMWLAGEYIEIVPTTRLVFTEMMADEQGKPLEGEQASPIIQIMVQLEALDGKTKMTMTHSGLPTDGAGVKGANAAFKQSFEKMANYLETIL